MQYDLKTMKTTNNDLWHRSHWWHWRRTGWLWYQDTFTWRYWLHDWQCNQQCVVVLLNSTTSQNKQNITSQHYTNNPALDNFQYQSDRTIAICRVNPNPTENNYFAACEDLCQPKLHWSGWTERKIIVFLGAVCMPTVSIVCKYKHTKCSMQKRTNTFLIRFLTVEIATYK